LVGSLHGGSLYHTKSSLSDQHVDIIIFNSGQIRTMQRCLLKVTPRSTSNMLTVSIVRTRNLSVIRTAHFWLVITRFCFPNLSFQRFWRQAQVIVAGRFWSLDHMTSWSHTLLRQRKNLKVITRSSHNFIIV
jgi:hypothetical protein